MKLFDILSLLLNGFFAWQLLRVFDWPWASCALIPIVLGAASGASLLKPGVKKAQGFLTGARFAYDPDTFCRGWLITGSTGSGKTASGLMRIAHFLYTYFPNWGGLVIDPKCVLWIAFQEIAEFYGKSDNFVNLAVSLEDAEPKILRLIKESGYNLPEEKHRYNLASYPGMTWTTKAKIIVDTATSTQGADDKPFFKVQAQMHIAKCLESLHEINDVPRFSECLRALTSEGRLRGIVDKLYQRTAFEILEYLKVHDSEKFDTFIADCTELRKIRFQENRTEVMSQLKNNHPAASGEELRSMMTEQHPELNPALLEAPVAQDEVIEFIGVTPLVEAIDSELYPTAYTLAQHWEEKYLIPAADQLEGIKGTITNYLQVFAIPEIEEIFSSEKPNTVEFEWIDQGKMICLSMPQKFQAERDYIFTFLKLMYYQHALNRFDYKNDSSRWGKRNMICFIADEAQGVATASEDGMADYNVADKIREALATIVFATQSPRSFMPRVKSEFKLEALLLNLKNQMVYQAADEKGALISADNIGKRIVWKKSYSSGNRSRTVSSQEQEEHFFKPSKLRAMKKFECVIKHPEDGHQKVKLPPLDQNGKLSERYLELFSEHL